MLDIPVRNALIEERLKRKIEMDCVTRALVADTESIPM
jgi:hypothetical protein